MSRMSVNVKCWGRDPREIHSFPVPSSEKFVILVHGDDREIQVVPHEGHQDRVNNGHLLAHIVIDPHNPANPQSPWSANVSCLPFTNTLDVHHLHAGSSYVQINRKSLDYSFTIELGDVMKLLDPNRSSCAYRIEFTSFGEESSAVGLRGLQQLDYLPICKIMGWLPATSCMDRLALVGFKLAEAIEFGTVDWEVIDVVRDKNVLGWTDIVRLCMLARPSATSLSLPVPSFLAGGIGSTTTVNDVAKILGFFWPKLHHLTLRFSRHWLPPRYETKPCAVLAIPSGVKELWIEAVDFSSHEWIMLDFSPANDLKTLGVHVKGDWDFERTIENLLTCVKPLERLFLHEEDCQRRPALSGWDLIPDGHVDSLKELKAFIGSQYVRPVGRPFPAVEKLAIACGGPVHSVRNETFERFPAINTLCVDKPAAVQWSGVPPVGLEGIRQLSTWVRLWASSLQFLQRMPLLRWLYLEVHPLSEKPELYDSQRGEKYTMILSDLVVSDLVGLRLTGGGLMELDMGGVFKRWCGPLEFLAFLVEAVAPPRDDDILGILSRFRHLKHLSFVGTSQFTVSHTLASFIFNDRENLEYFGILAVTPEQYKTATSEKKGVVDAWAAEQVALISSRCPPTWCCEAMGPALVLWRKSCKRPEVQAYLGPELFFRSPEEFANEGM